MRYLMAGLIACAALGQQLDLSRLDGLAAKARESANVNLDADKLRMLSGFVEDKDKAAQKLLSSMRGVYVRSFEFDASGAYNQADLEAIRAQLKGPNWVRVIEVKERDESAEVWFYSDGGKPGGLAVIAAEPKELAVVNIVGPIDLQTLGKLAGSMGIPNIRLGWTEPKGSSPPPKKEK
jgi:hypothetical protein